MRKENNENTIFSLVPKGRRENHWNPIFLLLKFCASSVGFSVTIPPIEDFHHTDWGKYFSFSGFHRFPSWLGQTTYLITAQYGPCIAQERTGAETGVALHQSMLGAEGTSVITPGVRRTLRVASSQPGCERVSVSNRQNKLSLLPVTPASLHCLLCQNECEGQERLQYFKTHMLSYLLHF